MNLTNIVFLLPYRKNDVPAYELKQQFAGGVVEDHHLHEQVPICPSLSVPTKIIISNIYKINKLIFFNLA